jgi:signal transduction histidine kinase
LAETNPNPTAEPPREDPSLGPRPWLAQDLRLRLLFLATSVVVLLPAFLHLSEAPVQRWILVLLAVAYLWFGFREFLRVAHGTFSLRTYVLTQAALALALIYVADGYGAASVILVPLATQIAMVAPPRVGYLVAAMLAVGNAVPYLLLGFTGKDGLFPMLLAYGTAIFFGTLFAHVLRRADKAREELSGLQRELAARQMELRLRSQQVAELAIAEERIRGARTMLDEIVKRLSSTDERLAAAEGAMSRDVAEASPQVAKARLDMRKIQGDLRHAIEGLRSEPTLRLPLPSSLRELVDGVRGGPATSLEVIGDVGALQGAAQVALHRLAQEVLAAAHGSKETRHVALTLRSGPQDVVLVIDISGGGPSIEAVVLPLRERLKGAAVELDLKRNGDQLQVVATTRRQPRNP